MHCILTMIKNHGGVADESYCLVSADRLHPHDEWHSEATAGRARTQGES